MQLTEQYHIKPSSPYYAKCYELCNKSALLYNASLYVVKQHFFETGKYLNYYAVNKMFVENDNKDYRALPAKVAQQTMKLADQDFKAFFAARKSPKMKGKKVHVPDYCRADDKGNKLKPVFFTNQAISKPFLKIGIIKPCDTDFEIPMVKAIDHDVNLVRIVPKKGYFVIEVVYTVIEKVNPALKYVAAIDLGVNNLATLVIPGVADPIIFNGRPLKSINQYYNKERAKLDCKKQSKRLETLTNKRNNKVNDYMHKTSRSMVNYLASHNVKTLIIGFNKEWKQSTGIGRANNQNFVGIPHSKFIEMLKYKCALEGITVVLQEESYTSKCSALDKETIGKHKAYKGSRVKRGLFKSASGQLVNADVNGAYNIYRKHQNAAGKRPRLNSVEVCRTPVVYTTKL